MALVTQIYVEKATRFPQASGCAAPHLHNEQVAFTLYGSIFSTYYERNRLETSDILDPLRFLELRDNLRGKLLMKIKNFSICNCHTIQKVPPRDGPYSKP